MADTIIGNVDVGERQNENNAKFLQFRIIKNWKMILFAAILQYLRHNFKDNTFSMEILSWMDLKVDPCEDFYKFSCGGFMEKHTKSYPNHVDASFLVYADNVVLVHSILESSEQLHGASELAKSFFSSCSRANGTGKYNCFKKTQSYFPDVVGRIFSEKVVTTGKKKKVYEYFQEISTILQDKVRHWDFLDDASREIIIWRLSHTPLIVGAPPHILDASIENEVYKELSISEDLETNINIMKAFNSTRVPMTGSEHCNTKGVQRSAFYLPLEDKIFIPAGILNYPFFSEGHPDVLKYSRLGFTIGHEYGHALLQYTRDLLKSGTFRKDKKKDYITGSLCIQHSSYCLPNSNLTLNNASYAMEDFADIIGLEVAFKAFQNRVRMDPDDKPLQGLEHFTKEQIFFVSAAQYFCQAFENEEIRRNFLQNPTDPTHSPPEFRVLIKMTNSIDFAKAFSCPLGSNYNPYKKCSRYF